jgi:hypothetical protein
MVLGEEVNGEMILQDFDVGMFLNLFQQCFLNLGAVLSFDEEAIF